VISSLLFLSLWGSPQALADCPEGLRPCETVDAPMQSVEVVETGAEVVEVVEAEAEPVVVVLDEIAHMGPRPPYWYEWITDLLWIPGEILHFCGIIGADHRDAAALGVLYALLHRLWMWGYAPLAPWVAVIRRRLGFNDRGDVSGEDVEDLISWQVSEVLDTHLSETQREINLLRTQNEILTKQIAAQQAANVALRDASERLLASAYGAAGYPPGGE